jgi:hypothetical protein
MATIKKLTTESVNSIEYMLRWEWSNDEYLDDAIDRATCVAAVKLAFWRKNPKVSSVRLVRIISSAWFELCAFFSYERGKYYIDFRERVFRKLGRSEVFMEFDCYRLESL